MSYITTYTEKHIDPVSPDPRMIDIADIAHALSLICRGNGHVKTFWSVGEHCIACAKEAAARGLPDYMVLACLLHDASECYMSDVPRPFKQELPRYREIEEHLISVIYEKFLGSNLTSEEKAELREIDNDMLWYDMKYLLGEKDSGEPPEIHIDVDYTVRPFEDVEAEYFELFLKHYIVEVELEGKFNITPGTALIIKTDKMLYAGQTIIADGEKYRIMSFMGSIDKLAVLVDSISGA